MTTESEDVLFASLIAEAANPRLKASIERVKAACDFLESARAAITPTAVGKYCEERWEGPKAQSIRNASSTLLRYVETRKGRQKLPSSQKRSVGEPLIEDETIKAYVSILRAERDEAIRLKDRIIQGLRKVPGIPIDELIGNGFKPVSAPALMSSSPVSGAVVAAINKLLDPDRLSKVGLELHRDRLRSRTTGDLLLDKADIEALRQMTAEPTAPSEVSSTPSVPSAKRIK